MYSCVWELYGKCTRLFRVKELGDEKPRIVPKCFKIDENELARNLTLGQETQIVAWWLCVCGSVALWLCSCVAV